MAIKRAFTLIELLVVIAIIAILAAILFPVFAQAKQAAKKTQCLSNFKQSGLGIIMYAGDYDDMMVPADSGGLNLIGWGYGRPDYVWPELVQPYIKNWYIFRCPSDPNETDTTLSVDPVTNAPITSSNPNYYYAWGERADQGINYEFLTPWSFYPTTGGYYVGSEPISLTRIGGPANTIAAIDTIWDRDAGGPKGGGNWTVEAPCVYDASFNLIVPINPTHWFSYGGWDVGNNTSWLEFGGAWPRHSQRFNVTYMDGHAHNESVGSISLGCNVLPWHTGTAYDLDKYKWDITQ